MQKPQPDSSNKAKKKGQIYCIASSIKTASAIKTTSTIDGKIFGKTSKPGSNQLAGVKTDLHIMYKWALENQIDYRGELIFAEGYINQKSKKLLMSELKQIFQCADAYATTYLYYTGHGDQEGSWALQTSTEIIKISPNDILQLWVEQFDRRKNRELIIILDQCFAGKWFGELFPSSGQQTVLLKQLDLTFNSNQLGLQQTGNDQFQTRIKIQASCSAQEFSQDWGLSKGSAFTSTRYGNLQQLLDISQNPQSRGFTIQNKSIRDLNVMKSIKEQRQQKLNDLKSQQTMEARRKQLQILKKQPKFQYRNKRQLKVLFSILGQLQKQLRELDQN